MSSPGPPQRKADLLPRHLRTELEPLAEPDEKNGMESEEYDDFDDGDPIIIDPTDTVWDGDWE